MQPATYGEMQEWLNWPLSKSGEPQGSEGSNPSFSAIENTPPLWRGIFYGSEVRTLGRQL